MDETIVRNTGKLGFGLMRLPRKGIFTDVAQVSRMVDLFLQAGFTYFDTAYIYPGSEEAIRKALVERYPRDSFTLATKMNAFLMAPTQKAAENQFYKSLERTGAGYFDYYLLHGLMENNYEKYERFHLWDFVKAQKEKGLIRNLGFSFHAGPELLDRLLTQHPEADFVQLQINYADWDNPRVRSRENYEVARKHHKPIVVMEPVKGGALADPPEEVKKLFSSCHPEFSYASWAIRFVASLDGILTVLSGMSNVAQMEDNLSFMRSFKPLAEQEQEIIRKAQRILGHSAAIPCTACHYCTGGCPKQIPIPEIFASMNLELGNGQMDKARKAYAAATEGKGKTSDCIHCLQCERACPQHLSITKYLEESRKMLEDRA